MPFSAPLPDGSSMNVGGDRMLVFTPGESLATDMRVPGLPWPQPWGIDAAANELSELVLRGVLSRSST
jgi:hypothetical protein